jgi:hypothetical protein
MIYPPELGARRGERHMNNNNHFLQSDFDPREADHCIEHYATEIGFIEPAGGTNLRFYRGVRSGRIFVPVYKVVIPFECLIGEMDGVILAAREVLARHERVTALAN